MAVGLGDAGRRSVAQWAICSCKWSRKPLSGGLAFNSSVRTFTTTPRGTPSRRSGFLQDVAKWPSRGFEQFALSSFGDDSFFNRLAV